MKLYEINDLIAAVAPIRGVNSNGEIDFEPLATEAEKEAAYSIMENNIGLLDAD